MIGQSKTQCSGHIHQSLIDGNCENNSLAALSLNCLCSGLDRDNPQLPIHPFTRLTLSLRGEHGYAGDVVLVGMSLCVWKSPSILTLIQGEPVLLPGSASCISPHDWYPNILTSCFLCRNISSTEFPSAQETCNSFLWLFLNLSHVSPQSKPLHLQFNHISLRPQVTVYSLASHFLLYSRINLV